jgi:hypothetical protein
MDTVAATSLKRGDFVQVAGGIYEPLLGFLHRDQSGGTMPFVEIDFSDGQNFTATEMLSPDHMLFSAEGLLRTYMIQISKTKNRVQIS